MPRGPLRTSATWTVARVSTAPAPVDVVSIRDLLYWELDERSSEVDSLRRYIGGSY